MANRSRIIKVMATSLLVFAIVVYRPFLTLLLGFAAAFKNASMVGWCLRLGADSEFRDNGRTALMYAVEQNNLEIARAIVTGGGNVNAVYEDSGVTALIAASAEGFEEMVHILVEGGAKIDQVDKSGDDAIRAAERYPAIQQYLKTKRHKR